MNSLNVLMILIVASLVWGTVSCENKNKDNVTQIIETDSFKIQDFIEINGYSIFTGDYDYSIVEDTFEIKVLRDFHCVSYCGSYGYSLIGYFSDDLTFTITEMATGYMLKSKLLKDIIKDSEFSEVLNEYYERSYNDTFGWIRSKYGPYYFSYDIRNIFPSTMGIVIESSWVGGVYSSRTSGLYLFINADLELTKFAPVSHVSSSPDLLIDYGDSILFASGPLLRGMYHFNNRKHNVHEDGYQLLFDFANLEIANQSPKEIIVKSLGDTHIAFLSESYGDLPDAVIEGKHIYIYANDSITPILIVYNPLAKNVFIFNSPTLNMLLDGSKHFYLEQLSIQGLSDEYIYIRRSVTENFFNIYFSDPPPIYAIPRKILNYAI